MFKRVVKFKHLSSFLSIRDRTSKFYPMLSYWLVLGNSILFIDSGFGVTEQRIALWIISVAESVQHLSKSVSELIATRKTQVSDSVHGSHASPAVGRHDFNQRWCLFFLFFFLKETDGNTKQLPLLRSSRSFFLCGFSELLSRSRSLLWQDG